MKALSAPVNQYQLIRNSSNEEFYEPRSASFEAIVSKWGPACKGYCMCDL